VAITEKKLKNGAQENSKRAVFGAAEELSQNDIT
jgi:hypothetical protein